jgi:hypothetical protein
MPHNLHIVKTNEFIRLDAHGKPDLEQSRKILSSIAKTFVERGIDCALIDVRDLRADMSINDLYRLVHAFPEMGFQPKHRLAVLHRYRAEPPEVFATLASDEGWNVRSFEEYEDAIEWFTSQEPVDKNKPRGS